MWYTWHEISPKRSKLCHASHTYQMDQDSRDTTTKRDFEVCRGDCKVYVMERSSSYSHPDNVFESSASGSMTLIVPADASACFTVFHVDAQGVGAYLSAGSYDIVRGMITFVSTQMLLPDAEALAEALWKVLYIQAHTRSDEAAIRAAQKLLGITTRGNAHLLLFHQFSNFRGDSSEGMFERKAAAYGWDTAALLAEYNV